MKEFFLLEWINKKVYIAILLITCAFSCTFLTLVLNNIWEPVQQYMLGYQILIHTGIVLVAIIADFVLLMILLLIVWFLKKFLKK